MSKESAAVVYKVLTGIMLKYYDPFPLRNLDLFIRDLRNSGKESMQADENFPIDFYRECVNALITWCIDSFKDLSRDRIYPMFQQVWGFHKRMLEFDASDNASDTLLAEANEICNGIERKEERALYIAVLHEYTRLCNTKEANGQP